MFKHNFYKGARNFSKRKKIIFLIIRKQPGEIDWILPVLNNIKNKFNIIVIFEKRISIKLLKQNKILYKIFLNTVCCYFINSYLKCCIIRSLHKLLIYFNLKQLQLTYQEKIFKKYYDINELMNILNKNNMQLAMNNIKLLMQDFTDNSPWIKQFNNKISDSIIISYPHTTRIFSTKKNNFIIKNKKKNRNFLFLSSKNDLNNFKKKVKGKNINFCGYPKYEKQWLKTIELNSTSEYIKSNRSKNIFISYKGYEESKYFKKDYVEQVKSLFDVAMKNDEYKLVFKFHPNVQEEEIFLSVANKYPKKIWSITKAHLHIALKNSEVCIFFYNNASVLDILACGKIPIQLWNISLNKKLVSNYTNLKLCLNTKNELELIKYIKFITNKKKKHSQNKIILRFNKLFRNFNSIKFTSNQIIKISKLNMNNIKLI